VTEERLLGRPVGAGRSRARRAQDPGADEHRRWQVGGIGNASNRFVLFLAQAHGVATRAFPVGRVELLPSGMDRRSYGRVPRERTRSTCDQNC
jgi:hypothetical protein